MKQQSHIGKTVSTKTITIEEGMVSRFVDALELADPLSQDHDAAQAAGLKGLVLPHFAAGSLGDYDAAIELLELRPKQVLHSRETVAVFEPLVVGEVLEVNTVIRELFEQQAGGNPMGFVAIDVIGRDMKHNLMFEAQRLLAIRGGFPRR